MVSVTLETTEVRDIGLWFDGKEGFIFFFFWNELYVREFPGGGDSSCGQQKLEKLTKDWGQLWGTFLRH